MSQNRRCIIPWCRHQRHKHYCTFSKFPSSPERCKKWVKNIGMPQLVHYTMSRLSRTYICCCHFLKSDYSEPPNPDTLNSYAVPTRFGISHVPLSDEDMQGFLEKPGVVAQPTTNTKDTVPVVPVSPVSVCNNTVNNIVQPETPKSTFIVQPVTPKPTFIVQPVIPKPTFIVQPVTPKPTFILPNPNVHYVLFDTNDKNYKALVEIVNRTKEITPKNVVEQGKSLENQKILKVDNKPKPPKFAFWYKKQKTSITKPHAATNEISINALSDACLQKIFMELPVIDRVFISGVCKRWESVSKDAWTDIQSVVLSEKKGRTNWYRTIPGSDKPENYNLDEPMLKMILKRCGHFLTEQLSLNVKNVIYASYIVKLIIMYCPNVTKIDLSFHKYPENEIGELFCGLKKLNSIKIQSCERGFTGESLLKLPSEIITELQLGTTTHQYKHVDFPHSAAEAIDKLQNLHTLALHMFTFSSNQLEFITANKMLKNVYLNNSILNVSSNYLQNLHHVEHLDLSSIKKFPDHFFSSLAKNCRELKYLKINDCHGISEEDICEIASLPQLESLEICHTARHIEGLNLAKMTQLKKLNCSSSLGIQDHGIIAFIESTPSLEELDVRSTGITLASLKAARKVTRQCTDGPVLNIIVSSWVKKEYVRRGYNVFSPFLKIDGNVDLDQNCRYSCDANCGCGEVINKVPTYSSDSSESDYVYEYLDE